MHYTFHVLTFVLIIGIVIAAILRILWIQKKDRDLLCSVSSPHRGTYSEQRLVIELLKCGIHPDTIFHDIYIDKGNYMYSQVDIVIPTKAGIIVIEVKDYSGWIFGNGKHKYWTQILNYGNEKHRFYNPILQNEGHISALKQIFYTNPNIPYFSLIVFCGSSEIKKLSDIPANTFVIYPFHIVDTINRIIANNPPAQYGNKWDILMQLKSAKENGNKQEIVRRHAYNTSKIEKPASTYTPRLRLFHFRRFRFPRR